MGFLSRMGTLSSIMAEKTHMSVVICGHVDSGKSTTTGRLLFELGGIPERDMQKLKEEAERIGKGSFAFAFYMDTQKDERDRGVTIKCTTKEFFTDQYHYSVIDAPGHRDFIKNMISGAAQADVGVLMVPSDGNFTTAIQKGDHKQGIVQGQTRQHARLINLLGVKQLVVGVNKMDCDVAKYSEARYTEIRDEMKSMLIKGVGDVLTGRIEQGAVKPGEEVLFLPTHTASTACPGKIFTVEMHHKKIDAGRSGDNIGMNVKNLNKENMPRVGDVMIYKSDSTLATSENFTANVQVLDIPGSLKCGYSPIGHVRCGRAACRMVSITWRQGKDTGNEKTEGGVELKTNDAAGVIFVPQQPMVVDTFDNCEGLARIAMLDGNSAVMLGKVCEVNTPGVDDGRKKK